MKPPFRIPIIAGFSVVLITISIVYQYTAVNSRRSLLPIANNSVPQIPDLPDPPDLPLLTMFTTFAEIPIDGYHEFVLHHLIQNWASLAPSVKLVVFVDTLDSELAKLALENKWDVLPLTRVNPSGAPFLKDMCSAVFDKYKSSFYGFATGDLLFNDNLVSTLNDIKHNLKHLQDNVLVVGRRTNVEVLNNTQNATQDFTKNNLQELARTQGKLYVPDAEDYLIFSGDGCSMNWSSLADIVVGRPAYNNYLVAMAKRHKVHTIDVTKTVLAVHMSKEGVDDDNNLKPDKNFNLNAIGSFSCSEGFTTKTALLTENDIAGRAQIARR